jgi:hypothetical protein
LMITKTKAKSQTTSLQVWTAMPKLPRRLQSLQRYFSYSLISHGLEGWHFMQARDSSPNEGKKVIPAAEVAEVSGHQICCNQLTWFSVKRCWSISLGGRVSGQA